MHVCKTPYMDEEKLIKGCVSRDERSFRLLYESYYGKMLRVCMQFANSRDEAKDMVQEGFIRAFKNIHQYNFTGSFEGWLRQTVRNTAINFLKKDRLRNISDSIDNSYSTMRRLETQTGSENILSNLSADELFRLIQQLPTTYRTVFCLYIFEEMQHKEIAAILNITESTSRSNLTKARMKLQQQLNKLHKSELKYVNERV